MTDFSPPPLPLTLFITNGNSMRMKKWTVQISGLMIEKCVALDEFLITTVCSMGCHWMGEVYCVFYKYPAVGCTVYMSVRKLYARPL